MSDASSDFANLANAFAGFAQSVKTLHDVRVEAETTRRSLEISAARYQYLNRFNLKDGDPMKLTANEDGPNSWREPLKELEQQTEGYLSSVKDPRIQEGVRGKLKGNEQQFMLDFQATMVKAEKELTQQEYTKSFSVAFDSGNTGEIKRLYEEIVQRQIFDPVTTENIRRQYLVPIEANDVIARNSDPVMYSAEKIVESQKSVPMHYPKNMAGKDIPNDDISKDRPDRGYETVESVETEVKYRPPTVNEKIAKVSVDKEVKSSMVRDAALKMLDAEQKGWEEKADSFMKDVQEQQKNGIEIDAKQYYTTLAELYGNVSDEKYTELLAPGYKAITMEGEAGMDQFMASVYLLGGTEVDAAGNVVSASKKITPEDGIAFIQQLRAQWGEASIGNTILSEKIKIAENNIREMMATDQVDLSAIADRRFNTARVAFTLKMGTTGADLFGVMMDNAKYWSASEFQTHFEEFFNGDYIDPKAKALLSDSSIKEAMLVLAKDSTVVGDGKEFVDYLTGKGENYRLASGYQDMMASLMDDIVKGNFASSSDVVKLVNDRGMAFLKDMEQKKYEALKLKVSDAVYHQKLSGSAADVLYGNKKVTVAGHVVTSSLIDEVQRNVDSLSAGTLSIITGKSQVAFTSLRGGDGNIYYIDRDDPSSVFKMTPGPDGLGYTKYVFSKEVPAGTVGIGSMVSALMKGSPEGLMMRTDGTFKSVDYLERLKETVMTPTEIADAKRAYEASVPVYDHNLTVPGGVMPDTATVDYKPKGEAPTKAASSATTTGTPAFDPFKQTTTTTQPGKGMYKP